MAQPIDYDAKLFRLGSLCKRSHAWPGTAQSLRRSCMRGGCVECEKTRLYGGTTSRNEYRRERNREIRQQLRDQGLTTRRTVPTRADGGVQKGEKNELVLLNNALQSAIYSAGRSTVVRLVMDEQLRHWRENPEEKCRHDKEWAQARWWLKYQINPELRLYTRQKSKRRKAQMRNSVAIQVAGNQISARFSEFNHRCAYCSVACDLHIEHVVPISKGGGHALGNIVPACKSCNYSKRNHEAETWYRQQPFFSETRWRKICRVLGWNRSSVGQLALL